MERRNVVIAAAIGLGLLSWWGFSREQKAHSVAAPLEQGVSAKTAETISPLLTAADHVEKVTLKVSGAVLVQERNERNISVRAQIYLPVEQDNTRFTHALRSTAIRQANSLALAQLPANIVQALAELRLADAQRLLEPLAAKGHTSADRLLASMGRRKARQESCLPHTEFLAESVPVQSLALFDLHRSNALAVVPPELAGRLAELPPLFERSSVLAACSELSMDTWSSWLRIQASASHDDEDRLFLSRYIHELGLEMPPRAPDADGNPRPVYSREKQFAIAHALKFGWRPIPDVAERGKYLAATAVSAEPYPQLYSLAGDTLLFRHHPTLRPAQRALAMQYLANASERGSRVSIELYGIELMRYADSIEHGYMLSLFARHLNARGCYPGDYLQEWERQYRYVEEYAQAMSPVTLEIVNEKAEKYIKAHAGQAYEHLHCRE